MRIRGWLASSRSILLLYVLIAALLFPAAVYAECIYNVEWGSPLYQQKAALSCWGPIVYYNVTPVPTPIIPKMCSDYCNSYAPPANAPTVPTSPAPTPPPTNTPTTNACGISCRPPFEVGSNCTCVNPSPPSGCMLSCRPPFVVDNSCTCVDPTKPTTPAPTGDCTVPGTRPATKDDAVVKSGTLTEGTCYNPNDPGVSSNASEAKNYLNSLPNKCVGGCQAPPDKDHVNKLDNTFAVCAAQFFKEYQAKYGPVSISSAFRCGPLTPSVVQCDRTENQRAGGKGASNHQLGLAIDVNPAGGNSSYQTLWSFSKANPQLGICFPHQDGSTATHYPDRPHMILAGLKGGEGSACAQMGITKPCNGLPTPTVYGGEAPNSPYFSPGSPLGSSSQAPQSSITPGITSALAGMLRSFLGMQQSPTADYLPTMQEQSFPQVQAPYYDASTQYQAQTTGDGTPASGAGSSQSQGQSSADYNSDFNVNDNGTGAGDGSSSDSIGSFVKLLDSGQNNVNVNNVTVNLNSDITSGAGNRIAMVPVNPAGPPKLDQQYVPNTVATERPSNAQQTFQEESVRGDYQKSGNDTTYKPQSSGFTGTAGNQERTNIFKTIAYIIQPFRGRNPHAPITEVE